MTREELAERDARIGAWLMGVDLGDIVTVRLNSTDTLTGKVYEAPDSSGRTALYVQTTILRFGNGYPGPHFEPLSGTADVWIDSSEDGPYLLCRRDECMRRHPMAVGGRKFWLQIDLPYQCTPEQAAAIRDEHVASHG